LVANSDGAIQGDLQHFSLNNVPKYRALSYTWGKADAIHSITIDDQDFMVRPNLLDFLQLYASRHPQEWIWIDQICIAQDDVDEKNTQVPLMSQIYRKAQEVIIWLVPDEAQTRTREFYLRFEWRVYARARELLGWWRSEPHMLQRGQCGAHCQNHHYLRGVGRCVWLARLMNNEYWYRVWILQEAILAEARTVWYGLSVMDWSEINRLVLLEHQCYDMRVNHQLRWLCHSTYHPQGREIRLSDALGICARSTCFNPRDKIYGLQGMLSNAERVKVDYNKPSKVVYAEAVALLATRVSLCHVLACSGAYLAQSMGISVKDDEVDCTPDGRQQISFFDDLGDRRMYWCIFNCIGGERSGRNRDGQWRLNVPKNFREKLEKAVVEL
jgi:hypothetical protein